MKQIFRKGDFSTEGHELGLWRSLCLAAGIDEDDPEAEVTVKVVGGRDSTMPRPEIEQLSLWQ